MIKSSKKKKKSKDYKSGLFFILVLTLIAFIFRIYHISFQSFWIDESYSINAAFAILKNGIPLLDSGLLYGKSSLLFHYILSLSILSFGFSEFSARLISVLFGSLTIPVIYFFTKELASKRNAIFVSVLMIFLSIAIAWSRQARMYAMLQFFFLLSLLFFYRWIKYKDKKNLIYCTISSVCASLTQPLGVLLFLIYFLYLSTIFILDLKNVKKNIKFTKEFIFNNKKVILSILLLLALLFLWYYNSIINILLNTGMNYFSQYIFYYKSEFLIFFLWGLTGFFFINNKKINVLLIIALIVPFYFISFHQMLFHYRYHFMSLPLIFILSSYSFFFLYDRFKYLPIKIIFTGIFSYLMIISGMFTLIPQKDYNLEYMTPQPDFKSAYNYIKGNYNEDSIVIASYSTFAKIYDVNVDYALEITLSRIPGSTIKACRECDYDLYSKMPLILDAKQLNTLIKTNKQGFIIVDTMSSLRILDKEVKKIIQNQTILFQKDNGINSKITVYGWTNT
jgi:4-amino-4-deoxy-L-arabinose transferase-like glycosyltransferase